MDNSAGADIECEQHVRLVSQKLNWLWILYILVFVPLLILWSLFWSVYQKEEITLNDVQEITKTFFTVFNHTKLFY